MSDKITITIKPENWNQIYNQLLKDYYDACKKCHKSNLYTTKDDGTYVDKYSNISKGTFHVKSNHTHLHYVDDKIVKCTCDWIVNVE